MPFDGLFFRRMSKKIQEDLVDARITKIVQISEKDFLFFVRAYDKNLPLLISLQNIGPHFTYMESFQDQTIYPSHFLTILKNNMEDSKIISLQQVHFDRILEIIYIKQNEIYEQVTRKLFVEFTGKFTNIIITKEDHTIIDAFHRVSPLENERTIQPGAIYRNPPFPEKKNPFQDPYDPNYTLASQFYGFSSFLEKEVLYRIQNQQQTLSEIMDELMNSSSIYVIQTSKGKEFHCLPLTYLGSVNQILPLSTGLEQFYQEKLNMLRHQQKTQEIGALVKNELAKYRKKVEKLVIELEVSKSGEMYATYGELLFTYGMNEKKGLKELLITPFGEEKSIRVPLDEKLDVLGNANKYYKKYQKCKTGVIMIAKQIELAKNEIEYFELLSLQLETIDTLGLQQMKEELQLGRYLKISAPIKKGKKPAVKKYPPTIYTSLDGTKVSVGKNNLQNEYLSFTLARQNEYFFHVKDYPGSHVILHSIEPSEDSIRYAANLAAYFSKAKYSSSVAVDYTLVKNIKKISGSKTGMVLFKTNKTIYIDPYEPTK